MKGTTIINLGEFLELNTCRQRQHWTNKNHG